MKIYRFEIILLVINAIYMILELVASRVLSPYWGNSNAVWTSVIGIILLSSSVGNYIGGILADKKNISIKLKGMLILSFLTIAIIPFIQTPIINTVDFIINDIRVGAVISTILLFFIPSLLIGIISPMILKLKLESLETAGKVSGKVSAISTLGGIFGTFFGGFYLIPQYGSVHILFLLAIVLLFMIPIVDWKIKTKEVIIIIFCTVILGIIMIYNMDTNEYIGEKVKEGEFGGAVSYDTQYGRVLIYNATKNDEEVRILNIDSGFESATYIDEDKRYDLVFEYTEDYDLMFEAGIEIKDTLLIGGAGYSYPKHYISKNPDKNMDVVEIDGEITELAKEYFYLDQLIEEFELDKNKRLNLITGDGRIYLNSNTKKYDAILNDAFSGTSPVKTLTTIEAAQAIKKSLNSNGLYLTNIISSLEGENSKFIRAEVNTLRKVFKNVYVIPCNTDDENSVQNNMVIATDDDISYENTYVLTVSDKDIVLTDDYCPVDTLIPLNQ